jgi:LmbE family N-acetylglucosaminyl deacetylase
MITLPRRRGKSNDSNRIEEKLWLNCSMVWIYLSPHLDDVALSGGGLVWEQVQQGERVEIWTICAGDPPPGPLSAYAASLHERWQTEQGAPAERRTEDGLACQRLGAVPRYFSLPDCIYRRSPESGESLYNSELELFGEVHPAEAGLVSLLTQELAQMIPPRASLVGPLAVGGHADHRLVRAAMEGLGLPAYYYADYPYVQWLKGISAELVTRMKPSAYPISEVGLVAWIESVACYPSQISTFWFSREDMELEIREYCQKIGGVQLWQHTEQSFG